jgi:GT2 family glycosyltransferase
MTGVKAVDTPREGGGNGDEVTVVVPTRNRAPILVQTLHSILAQEATRPTVIVVDDASTDETPDVVRALPGVHLIRHEHPTEQRVARNHGASAAVTPWLAFCDDDDLWAPHKLRRQLDAVGVTDADWCTVGALHVDENLCPTGGKRLADPGRIARRIRVENVVPGGGSGVLVRRALFERVGGFSEAARYVEDWDLWIRLSRQGTVACVDELLIAYRQWVRSFSHSSFESQYAAFSALTASAQPRGARGSARPRGTSAFEVGQRCRAESRRTIARDLPRLLSRNPSDTVPIALMLSLPEPALRALRLRRLGPARVQAALRWLAPYQAARPDTLAAAASL